MNYPQTLDYLYAKLPMFARLGAAAIKKDLDNTLKFCAHLDHPEKKFKSIHIAGTNGKGSTSHMLASIFQCAGFKTGLYTSPHLKDFRERIRINGEMISEEEVVDFVAENQNFIEDLAPSFFEATVAMAFQHFAEHQVDIAVIEVGLGGRLDSTNVIHPELSVITNISYDHMNLLGNTLPEIAREKAGIIKKNTPVIIGEMQDEVVSVFKNKAAENNSLIRFASEEWSLRSSEIDGSFRKVELENEKGKQSLSLDLLGTYQLKNIKTVLSAVDQLRNQGFKISSAAVSSALSQVKKLTGLMGRWQILKENPFVICDTGHNEDGIKEILHNIKAHPHQNLLMVIGMVKDKEIRKILSLLPKNAQYFFCAPNLERAKPAQELQTEAAKLGLVGEVYPSVVEAIKQAIAIANKDDLIFVGGSTFVVAEAI